MYITCEFHWVLQDSSNCFDIYAEAFVYMRKRTCTYPSLSLALSFSLTCRLLEELGSGQFGHVCKALWTVSDNTLLLAVKTLKPLAPEDEKVKFLQEAAIMGQFCHPNVVKLYGVVTMGEPVSVYTQIQSVHCVCR